MRCRRKSTQHDSGGCWFWSFSAVREPGPRLAKRPSQWAKPGADKSEMRNSDRIVIHRRFAWMGLPLALKQEKCDLRSAPSCANTENSKIPIPSVRSWQSQSATKRYYTRKHSGSRSLCVTCWHGSKCRRECRQRGRCAWLNRQPYRLESCCERQLAIPIPSFTKRHCCRNVPWLCQSPFVIMLTRARRPHTSHRADGWRLSTKVGLL